jgi:hypothetical protein
MKERPAVAEQQTGVPRLLNSSSWFFTTSPAEIAVIVTAGLGCSGYDKIFIAEPFTSAAAPDYKRG